jgi:hypothetical protein
MNIEINGNTYFVDLAEGRGWQVLLSTPAGARTIPVHDDATGDDPTFVVEDERKRQIVN